jgi:hypothetical protein
LNGDSLVLLDKPEGVIRQSFITGAKRRYICDAAHRGSTKCRIAPAANPTYETDPKPMFCGVFISRSCPARRSGPSARAI